MGQRNLAEGRIYGQRLDIAGVVGTRRRIPDVTDTDVAAQIFGDTFFKYRADQAHATIRMNIMSIGQGNTAAFLAAVLQGE